MGIKNIIYLIGLLIFIGFFLLGLVSMKNSQRLIEAHDRTASYNESVVNAVKVAVLSHEYVVQPYERIEYQLNRRFELLASNTFGSKAIEIKVGLLKRSLDRLKKIDTTKEITLNQRLLGKIKLYSNQIVLEIFHEIKQLNENINMLHEQSTRLTWAIIIFTIFSVLVLFLFLIKKIINPLDQISEGVNKIRQGDLEHKITSHPGMFKEFRSLITSLNQTSQDLESNLTALKQSKQELETIFNEAPTPMAIHNEDGEIIMINNVWEELTGYTHADIDTVAKWTSKVAPDDTAPRKEHIEELYDITHRIDEGEFEVTTKEGEKIIWAFSSAPLGTIDGRRVLISSAMDITELKRKDKLLIVQSRHAAMGEMIGMIAHQWRQPLAIIAMDANNMLLDIALDASDVRAVEKYARNTLDQTQHLSKTIDDFRNFFKPDKAIANIRLQDIIDETYSIVKDSLKNHSITLKTSNESKAEVAAYSRELMQVFINIINNAKDALLAEKRKEAVITLKVYDDEQYVNTEICDNGRGIDEDVLPKIFDPYFSTKDEKTGTGLGLYMSKMIIEEHLHGIIEARNTDKGACLTIRLLRIKEHDRSVEDRYSCT